MTTILITGAARGIGLELARQAADRGWRVVALTRGAPEEPLDADVIEGVDVRSTEALRDAADRLKGVAIDILVNNAGIIGPDRQSTLDTDFDGFLKTFDVNTLGPLRVAQAFLPNLRLARDRAGAARIVTISSQMGKMSYAKSDRIAYRASKAAVNKVMQGLATDLEPESIFVRLLHPGWVKTRMGGADAEVEIAEAAAGVLQRAAELDRSTTGTFVDFTGRTIPW